MANGDWLILDIDISNNLKNYSCCTYPFSDVTYTFKLERKPAYHVLYLIVPCAIISFLSVMSFFLPPDCGERIGLSITVLLAMAVYLIIVSEILPETSDYIPRLGLYYMITMGELALVVGATAIVLRCHFSRSKPPKFVTRCRRKRVGADNKTNNSKAALTMVNLDENSGTMDTKQNGMVHESDEKIKKTEDEEEVWAECWKDFARGLDILFLVFFTLLFLVTTLATLYSRKKHSL